MEVIRVFCLFLSLYGCFAPSNVLNWSFHWNGSNRINIANFRYIYDDQYIAFYRNLCNCFHTTPPPLGTRTVRSHRTSHTVNRSLAFFDINRTAFTECTWTRKAGYYAHPFIDVDVNSSYWKIPFERSSTHHSTIFANHRWVIIKFSNFTAQYSRWNGQEIWLRHWNADEMFRPSRSTAECAIICIRTEDLHEHTHKRYICNINRKYIIRIRDILTRSEWNGCFPLRLLAFCLFSFNIGIDNRFNFWILSNASFPKKKTPFTWNHFQR